ASWRTPPGNQLNLQLRVATPIRIQTSVTNALEQIMCSLPASTVASRPVQLIKSAPVGGTGRKNLGQPLDGLRNHFSVVAQGMWPNITNGTESWQSQVLQRQTSKTD